MIDNDQTAFTETKDKMNFHIGQIYELQGRHETAKQHYEQVLHSSTCDNQLRADVLRQLGWMFHTVEEFGERANRLNLATKCLQKSLELDPNNGRTWYFIGRCYAVMSRVHEAFAAYRSSIDKSEANADTWCSIGTLYQQQNQPMDALQAFVCAIQLDKSHGPAWFDLAMLYESLKQFPDALLCYQKGIQYGTSAATPALIQRVQLLENSISSSLSAFQSIPKSLPSLEEALSLPLASELTSGHRSTKKIASIPDPSDTPLLPAHEIDFLQQNDMPRQEILAKLQQQLISQRKQQNKSTTAIQACNDKLFTCQQFSASIQSDLRTQLAKIDESVRKTSAEVLAEFEKANRGKPTSEIRKLSLLNEDGMPPEPPTEPSLSLPKTALNPLTPTVFVETKKEALNANMESFLLRHPCAIVKNLSNVLKMDLSLFSTMTLVETAPSQKMEVRTQKKQPPDDNMDPNGNGHAWKCESIRHYTTILKHGTYQAEDFMKAVQDGAETDSDSNVSAAAKKARKNTLIKFGTNVDLSDSSMWRTQLAELDKLPPLLRVHHPRNMLSHLDHTVLGMNSVQLYIKVPGCRTPGHQENLNFCAININIGPGDCEWFCVAHEYWGVIQKFCEKNDVHFLHGSWWPNLTDLRKAHVPVYRFIQRAGDLVWVNAGTVHWVQATGWCNNIAWNVGPLTAEQYFLAAERYEWNKLQKFKSIVPMVHLTWAVARNVFIERKDEHLWKLIRLTLRRSIEYSQAMFECLRNSGKSIRFQAREKHEYAHYCQDCELEVFNILFIKEKEKDSAEYVVRCFDCARKLDRHLKGIHVLHQFKLKELLDTYDRFQLADST